jgi:hypothetical protein
MKRVCYEDKAQKYLTRQLSFSTTTTDLWVSMQLMVVVVVEADLGQNVHC